MRPESLGTVAQTESRRIVVVDNDQNYRERLIEELLIQGFAVHPFRDGDALLGSLDIAVEADLAVLDWDLPKISGLRLLALLRQHGVTVPVAFLAGNGAPGEPRDEETLKARERLAFEHGAIDFIAKCRDKQVLVRQFSNMVDLTRAKTLRNRAASEQLVGAQLLLKPEIRRAYWNRVDVDLTLGEYNVVHLLASKPGAFVTYRGVYDRLRHEGFIAGDGVDGYKANVRSAIKRIRNKFRVCDAAFDEIENYTGFGYCWRRSEIPAFRVALPNLQSPAMTSEHIASD